MSHARKSETKPKSSETKIPPKSHWTRVRENFEFDHEEETGHPLIGAHVQASCLRCHNDRGLVQVFVARGCGGCHPSPHRALLGLDCTRCHDQESWWEPAGLLLDHSRTAFPLVATHAMTPCDSCHPKASIADFRGAPARCELCHRNDAVGVAIPNHVTQGLLTDCENCHSALGWER